jgi:16S rRNA (guanine1516-N2)-methyltransferase
MLTTFPLGFDAPELRTQATNLIEQYGFYLDQHKLPRLQLTQSGLVLLMDTFLPLKVEFNARQSKDKTHGLVRACKPQAGMTILDVTAGWGRDAGLLAQQGATVIMLERQAIMAALLQDGLQRLGPEVLKLSCIHTYAMAYLNQLSSNRYPDVIYIDPMHPERQKSALVKKDMQALQQLFGPDDNVEELLTLARTKAKSRVVLKWPQRLPSLHPPTMSIPGKTVRFDVYI